MAKLTTPKNCCGTATWGNIATFTLLNVCVDPYAIEYAKKLDSAIKGVCNMAVKSVYSIGTFFFALVFFK